MERVNIVFMADENYDLNNIFEFKGIFWIPGNDSNQNTGTLHYSTEDGLELDLFGSFDEELDNASTANTIILGFTENGKKITLLNCREFSHSTSLPGFETSKVAALYCFIGEHFSSADDILFDSLQVEYHGLGAWLDIYGFKRPTYQNDPNSITLQYEQPPAIEFDLVEGWKVKIDFSYYAPFEGFIPRLKAVIEQRPEFILTPPSKSSYFAFRDRMDRFTHFLTLCYFAAPGIANVIGNINNPEPEKLELPVNPITIIFRSTTISHRRKRSNRRDFLLTYTDMARAFQKIVQHWWRLEVIAEASLDILVESLMERTAPVELRFLILVQALENWHRRLNDAHHADPVAHKKRVKEVKDAIKQSYPEWPHHKWLHEKIGYDHGPNLQARLEDIVTGIPDMVRSALLDNEPNFILRVKDNRNYFTHYGEQLEEKKAPLSELLVLSQKLMLILIICILKELGLTNDEIEALMFTKGPILFNHLISYDAGSSYREKMKKAKEARDK